MQVSKVAAMDESEFIIQGFAKNEALGIGPYVFIGKLGSDGWIDGETEFTPENAHILSEEIRKHAEYAASAADKGE